MGKHYDALTNSHRQQVDATFTLVERGFPVLTHKRDELREVLANLALASAPRKDDLTSEPGTHYQELTPWQREQVDATLWLLAQFCPEIDTEENRRAALSNLSNLLLSCLFHDTQSRAAYTLLLDIASQTQREGAIVAFVASTAIGRDVLEQRAIKWQEDHIHSGRKG